MLTRSSVWPRAWLGAVVVLGWCANASVVTAQNTAPTTPTGSAEFTKRFPDIGLTLTLPPLNNLVPCEHDDEQMTGSWHGEFAGSQVKITLQTSRLDAPGTGEPEDLLDRVIEAARNSQKNDGPKASFQRGELVEGPYGYVPYAALATGEVRVADSSQVTTQVAFLSGALRANAYSIRVDVEPPLAPEPLHAVMTFLKKGVDYKGELRDPKWTDEAARARWMKDAPPGTHKKFEGALRTEHYIILTNSSGGKAFAKKMEECYATIQRIYPFPEIRGRMLLPVFLFRTPTEYYQFFISAFPAAAEIAVLTKGVASQGFYATWYEAPNDPVHIHEATHQIFDSRLRLVGAGSWFQEGVAEYVSSKPNERGNAARLVKKREHPPIEQFVAVPSLIQGGLRADDFYKLAALLIEFLHDSKWGKDKFQDFLRAVGAVPPNDVAQIERAVQEVYGTSLKGLDDEWVEYCKKR